MVYDGIDFFEFIKMQGGGKNAVKKAAQCLGLSHHTVYKKLREMRNPDLLERKIYRVWMGNKGNILVQTSISISNDMTPEERDNLLKEWSNE